MRVSQAALLLVLVSAVLAAFLFLSPRTTIQAQGPGRPGDPGDRVVVRIMFLAGRQPVTWDDQ